MARRVVGDLMRRYYERRAPEYDDWWLGTGLFARRDRPGWGDEVELLASVLGSLPPARTLDVACGTGFLTRQLPGEVVALDQSESMPPATRSTSASSNPTRWRPSWAAACVLHSGRWFVVVEA